MVLDTTLFRINISSIKWPSDQFKRNGISWANDKNSIEFSFFFFFFWGFVNVNVSDFYDFEHNQLNEFFIARQSHIKWFFFSSLLIYLNFNATQKRSVRWEE